MSDLIAPHGKEQMLLPLLHATVRQNRGCSPMIIGRDNTGLADYSGPFDAQKIFEKIPKGALKCQNLNIDWTFWCNNYGGMASMKTLPHGKEDRWLLSGTRVGKTLSGGGALPGEFFRPAVIMALSDEYQRPEEKVEIKRHGAATCEVKNE